jgi:hypothetical protein
VGDVIEVQEEGRPVGFSFEEMLRYSGPGSPGGVALGFKVMERAFALLAPGDRVERREVVIEAAFRGPGARDACELVTRGLTEGRYLVLPALERPERGHTLRTFAFVVGYRGRRVSLLLREGIVSDEFVRLAQTPGLPPDEQERFTAMKQELADRLMGGPAVEALDVENPPEAPSPSG